MRSRASRDGCDQVDVGYGRGCRQAPVPRPPRQSLVEGWRPGSFAGGNLQVLVSDEDHPGPACRWGEGVSDPLRRVPLARLKKARAASPQLPITQWAVPGSVQPWSIAGSKPPATAADRPPHFAGRYRVVVVACDVDVLRLARERFLFGLDERSRRRRRERRWDRCLGGRRSGRVRNWASVAAPRSAGGHRRIGQGVLRHEVLKKPGLERRRFAGRR